MILTPYSTVWLSEVFFSVGQFVLILCGKQQSNHRLLCALGRQSATFPLLEWPPYLLKTRGEILCKRQWSSPLPSCKSPKLPQAISEAARNQNINTDKFGKHRQRKIEHGDLCTWRYTDLKCHCHGQILPFGYYTELTVWLKPMASVQNENLPLK